MTWPTCTCAARLCWFCHVLHMRLMNVCWYICNCNIPTLPPFLTSCTNISRTRVYCRVTSQPTSSTIRLRLACYESCLMLWRPLINDVWCWSVYWICCTVAVTITMRVWLVWNGSVLADVIRRWYKSASTQEHMAVSYHLLSQCLEFCRGSF